MVSRCRPHFQSNLQPTQPPPSQVGAFDRRRGCFLALGSRSHRDLAIYDNTWKVGFGLWNYRDPEFALEIALLAIGIILYLARNVTSAIRKFAIIGFGIGLVIVQIGDTYVPRAPLTDKATAMGVWIFYTLFVAVAFLVEKIGRQRQINAP